MRAEFQILEEEIDEDYEPSREEILEYAECLGMSPRSDTKYFHIAREGLKTPLPPPWRPAQLRNGDIVYYNPVTKVLQQEHPLDEYFKRKYIEEKKKDVQNSQPSKTSKKLKGLCEQLREPTTQETTQKTDKKLSQAADISQSNLSDVPLLNESVQLQEQFELIDNQFKFELTQYEKEQESFVMLYKMNRAKQFESDKQEISDSSFEDFNLNVPEKALQIRQKFLNQKEELKIKIQEETDQKLITEQSKLTEQSASKLLDYKAAQSIKNEQRIQQLQSEWESKLQSLKQKIKSTQKELDEKKLQQQSMVSQQQSNLKAKWLKIQGQYEKQIQKEYQQILLNMDEILKQKKNDIVIQFKQVKLQKSQELHNLYKENNEFNIKKRLREVYREKLELAKVSNLHDMENDVKQEEISQFEQMTENIINYKNMLRTNFVKLKQQQIDNERVYLSNYYKEQLQAFKVETFKSTELQIQKLELSQIVMANQSFSQLDNSQLKVQINPDSRIQKKELELQIQEYRTKIENLKSKLSNIDQTKRDEEFLIKVLNQNDKINFLQQSLQEQDNILNELTKLYVSQPVMTHKGSQQTPKLQEQDQLVNSVEQEIQWLVLQKERLKYDKKKLQKSYEKLSLLASTNDQVDTYNKCVNVVRNNQQILKNCEYIITQMQLNCQQYKQTKLIQYLKENDKLQEELQTQKSLIGSISQMQLDTSFPIYKQVSQSFHQSDSFDQSYLKQQTNNQKQLLRDIRDSLNKSMLSRMY
ncbi:unnamed protein product [Paramecium octaurelia]|uniref:WW domain-containing protein n=1 Tax=Paramecium octaurelia TaxID=43137 RepID=A0A8S1XHP3_PAROT|nr:unnamed protein product [Paramecium octaurelia]